jgi:hypothetical protein
VRPQLRRDLDIGPGIMSRNPTRREVLADAAAVAATVATPGSAIATSLAEQVEFASIRWPLWDIRRLVTPCAMPCSLAGRFGLTPGDCGSPKAGGESTSWSAARIGEGSLERFKKPLRWRCAGKLAFGR